MSAAAVSAQKTPPAADNYQFGTARIRIPAPDAFFDVFPRFTAVRDRFIATENPGLTSLAVHVPDLMAAELNKSQDIGLSFYTKVSVSKGLRTTNVTSAQFRTFIATLEEQFDASFDVNAPVIRNSVEKSRKALNKQYGNETDLDISATKNLGFFQNTANVFSGAVLITVEAYGSTIPMVGSLSLIHVKNRIVYVYVYRSLKDEQDPVILRDFTKKWTAAIIAANTVR
jgi:hypothetical protein